MSYYRRANTPSATYFFTVVTHRRQKILCDENIRIALRHAIQQTQADHPFKIDAWVLLPDHIHTIWTLPENDANFSKRWSLIKRYVSQACPQYYRADLIRESKAKRNESTIWQRRFWEHQIRDERDFQVHMDYIHYNPVKHGLVQKADDWPYSTLHKYIAHGVYKANWASSAPDDGVSAFGE